MGEKIAFFSPGSLLNYGGGDKWIINMGNILSAKGYEVSAYTSTMIGGAGKRLSEQDLLKNITFQYIELPYHSSPISPMKLKKIPEDNFDFVYIIGGYYGILKQLFEVKGIKTYGFHDPALQNPKNSLQKKILSTLIPRYDKVHLLSKEQNEIINNKNKFLLENTWLGEPVPMVEKFEKFTVLFFGRHENIKGIQTVEYIASNLPENIDLIITGTGESSSKLSGISRKNVRNLGFVDENELYSLLSKSHLVLFPSYVEASSLVMVEAISHHTPLVYRAIPQNELLKNSRMSIVANDDSEFLDAIVNTEKKYSEDKIMYLKSCAELPLLLMPKEDYMKKFIDNFLS
jgi:glycosyltransferase involved in cell wall biosynthesis